MPSADPTPKPNGLPPTNTDKSPTYLQYRAASNPITALSDPPASSATPPASNSREVSAQDTQVRSQTSAVVPQNAELSATIDLLLADLRQKYQRESEDIVARLDEMTRRLDRIEGVVRGGGS